MGLGGHAEIFDAELAGLMMAAHRAAAYTQNHLEITNIYIFTDCSSALTAIHRPTPTAGQYYSSSFCDTITHLLSANQQIKITLSWCPSHSGIKGNDRADMLAKKATELACNSPVGITRTNALRRTKVVATKVWRRE
jgi:ribonuclease HI